jgi:NDP-sugar pyrophosphorylase family protein
VLLRNADFLCDVPVADALADHRRAGVPATLVVAPHRPGYTALELDAQGRVLSIGGNPPADPGRVATTAMFLGLHFIEDDVFDLIPAGRPSDIVRDVYRGLAARGELGSWMHRGLFWEFGTPRDYLEGSLLLLGLRPDDRKRLGAMDPVRPLGDATVALGPGVDLHAGGIALAGRVALGFATRVGEGATIEDSVIMPEAWVGPGSRLRRTIVGMATEIPAGFEASDALLCADPDPERSVPPDVSRVGGLLVRPL